MLGEGGAPLIKEGPTLYYNCSPGLISACDPCDHTFEASTSVPTDLHPKR